MFYEDVVVQTGATVSDLAVAYGHHGVAAAAIWADAKNSHLAARGDPNTLRAGDTLYIPIPWELRLHVFSLTAGGVRFEVKRSGGGGTRLHWVQTVYQHNQPIGRTTPYCVDGCPPDDDLPFYFTDRENTADPSRRYWFQDQPSRRPPGPPLSDTRWRAILSAAVATNRRVTVFGSLVWGFNIDPAGTVKQVGPRAAVGEELQGHLNLLRKGVGTRGTPFSNQGWTFRAPPR